jgi:transglutaminase-like putative cysteine protease
MAITFVYAGETAILGVIPTPPTFGHFGVLTAQGIDSIVEQAVRASPELGIVFLIAVLMAGCALIADLAVAMRAPGVVALPVLAILAIPPIVEPGLSNAFWYIVTAAFFLAVLRIGARPSSKRATLVAGSIVIVGSLLVPFVIPGIDEDDAPTVAGIQAGVNPLINLGDDLRRGDTVLAATYTTSNSEGVYLRLATLEDFNGRSWTPNMAGTTPDNGVDNFPRPTGLSPRVATEDLFTNVRVSDISGRWLPVPYPATRVRNLEGSWHWEESGLSVRSNDTGVRGQEYRVDFLDVQPTMTQLQAIAPSPPGTDSPYLELPGELPPIIEQTAVDVTTPFASSYDKALAIQGYFLDGEFEYSENAPVEGNYDGTGSEVIGVFLEEKIGYCVHYASAMALMARSVGIPSRIAVGFQPGERAFTNGQTTYSVNSDDLHAWPELYFDGVGWLRFEPTPGRGEIPDWGAEVVDDPLTPENEAAPTTTPTPAAVAPERPDESLGPNQTDAGDEGGNPAGAITLGVLGLVILLGLTPLGVRTGIRWWRYRAMRRGTDAAAAAWAELRDTARDYGWAAPQSETPRAFEERLAMVLTDDGGALGTLRGNVETNAYGRPGVRTISVDELKAVRRSIIKAGTGGGRLRTLLLPPSLVAWVRNQDE